ncbi:MAG TPA: SDR family oxidoreductase [Longimicrobiaceae bacterium]|nr:SDR family oxidoreductase [Longimicrobiaceae bacterium]
MSDSVVLVTGGAGALGQAVVQAFLERGARVAVPFYKTDVPTALDSLPAERRERIHSFALDLTTERGAEQAIRQTVEWAGRLDVVAHLVGGYSGGALLGKTSVESWDRMMELNLKSAWLISRFAIPRMLEGGGGSLVFVSSRAARQDRGGHAAYSIAKAGLLVLAEAIAEEYRDQGIRANAVLPGTIDTEANRRAMSGADHGQWTSPAAIARVIAFLASPEAEAVNGAAVPVYGRS